MLETTTEESRGAGTEQVTELLAEATQDAAQRLEELARTTPAKEVRKAARRALYLLSQRGIVASATADAAPAVSQEGHAESLRAWASAYDGAGNRLLLLVLAGREGGSVTVAQVLGNDELGIRDLGIERRRAREIPQLMEALEKRIDDGLAVAEIEPDYARWLIDGLRAINLRRSKTTPAGFLDLAPRIGAPSSAYTSSPVYEHLISENGFVEEGVSTEPADLFRLPWFEPWFFAVEEVVPWLPQWMEAASAGPSAGDQLSVIEREAATALVPGHIRDLYIVRLEESADILRRRDRIAEAKQALYHAALLKTDASAADIPFTKALAARTLEAAAEMAAAANREGAAGTGTAVN